ncbi:MAG: hypothetical protein AAF628_32315 [Planctomycetota bacterium]
MRSRCWAAARTVGLLLVHPLAAQERLVEVPTWTWRRGSALAYDAARERLVRFGGMDGVWTFDETWEARRGEWARRDLALRPRARRDAAVAYDRRRHCTVWFGGVDHYGDLVTDGVWELDGAGWIPRSTASAPAPRAGHAMAFDEARGVVVLFGGWPTAVGAETWEWDGTSWTQRLPRTSPVRRTDHRMAYDARRGRVVLLHGDGGGGAVTWEWDGVDWAQRHSGLRGVSVAHTGMSYDRARHRVVLRASRDTWEWDGTTWELRQPGPRVQRPAVAFDEARGRVVMTDEHGSLWDWDGTQWRSFGDPAPPPGRVHQAMAYDARRDAVLMFGGASWFAKWTTGAINDTWTWDGHAWHARTPGTVPDARYGAAMVYDAARDRAVMFGGLPDSRFYVVSPVRHSTWEWDGVDWTARTPSTEPEPRGYAGMVYDRARQRVVLVGGRDSRTLPNFFGDTWEWDGSAWHQRADVAALASESTQIAYDAARQRTVLVGGSGRGDTWEWDGTTWRQIVGATAPALALAAPMYYDSLRRRVTLPGAETWEWDGAAWHRRGPAEQAPRWAGGWAYDHEHRRLVGFGELRSSGFDEFGVSRTVLFGDVVPATAEPVGSGCHTVGSPPVLLASGRPRLGSGGFGLDLVTTSGAPAALLLALNPFSASLGGGCVLQVSPFSLALARPTIANAAGFATWPLALSPHRGLLGLELTAQAMVGEPAGPWLGLSLSGGLRLTIGE